MILLLASLSTVFASPSLLNKPDANVSVTPHLELGFVAPVSHVIQFGQDGTEYDYIEEGGQDNLFPFLRLAIDVDMGKRHHLSFLYQPSTSTHACMPGETFKSTITFFLKAFRWKPDTDLISIG